MKIYPVLLKDKSWVNFHDKAGIICFKNSVNLEHLASKKAAEWDLHQTTHTSCFLLCCLQINANISNPESYFGPNKITCVLGKRSENFR